MQRLFSMFPPGLPGFALLLLRACVGIALLAESYGHRQGLSGWLQVAVVLVSLTLFVGYLTPIVAVVVLVLHGLIWFGLGIDNTLMAVIFILDAIALALLGPGAYSLDAHRFGRRVVVLPPT